MGLDIYAGTLTRYYSHNWKTVVQQWAEENGYSFNRITPDGEPADNEEEMSPAEVQAAVENWRDQILSAISQPGQPPYAPWLEDNEKPYYTDKPDWDAFGAMLLVAACRTYEEPVPSTVEKDWIFGEHTEFLHLFAQFLDVVADDAVIDVHVSAMVEQVQTALDVDFQSRGNMVGFFFLLLKQSVVQVLKDGHILRAGVRKIFAVNQMHTAVNDGFSTGSRPSLPPTTSSHKERIKSAFRDSGLSSSE